MTFTKINSEKLVSHKYKFSYICVPKVATRSLLTALFREPKHDYGAELFKITSFELFKKIPNFESYFKFSFVRNPFSRVVSCYLNKIENPKEDTINLILNKFEGLDPNMPFDKFVEFLGTEEGCDSNSDRHWLSQSEFLKNDKGEIFVDFIGRLENIDSDLQVLSTKLNVPEIKIPIINTRFKWNGDKSDISDQYYYRKYYTDKTRKIIENRYEEDLNRFGYEF